MAPSGSIDPPSRVEAPPDPFATAAPFSVDTPTPVSFERLAAEHAGLDPLLLAEDVELEPEVRRLLLYLHERRERLTHYELLAIDRDADRAAVRRAFLDRTKAFHPDRYFRKRLGSFADRLHDLYKAVSQAYDVLSDPDRRRVYDLSLEQSTRKGSPLDPSEEASRLYEEGKRLGARGDFRGAEHLVRQAHELEPERDSFRVQVQRLAGLNRRIAANEAYQRALPALRAGRYGEAVASLRATIEQVPEPEVLLVLATAIERSGGDPHESLALLRQALSARPDFVEATLRASELEESFGNAKAARELLRPLVSRAGDLPGLRERLARFGLTS